MGFENMISFGGFLALLLLAWLTSFHKRKFPFRTVLFGCGLQFLLGAFVFSSPLGRKLLLTLNGWVIKLVDYSGEGIRFLFGPLASGPGEPDSLGFILAIQYLPSIIFFMALMALLYQWNIMPFVVRLFSKVFVRLMKTSGAESLSVASNIFVGVESAGVVRPFLSSMSRSELLTMLTACMSTVASSTMAVYVGALKTVFPEIAGHLISASVLSAPAAIVISKIILPETGTPVTLGQVPPSVIERKSGVLEAIIGGAMDGMRQVAAISALLVAFLSFVALADGILDGAVGLIPGGSHSISIKTILSTLSFPLVWIMGISPHDAWNVAGLLGERILVTEIPAYVHLAELAQNGGISDPRSVVIASYALCGFTHVASVAIFVGGIGALAPDRIKDLSRLGFLALWAAVLATSATGCVAGLFYTGGQVILGGH